MTSYRRRLVGGWSLARLQICFLILGVLVWTAIAVGQSISPRVDQLRALYDLAMKERAPSLRLLATKVVTQEPLNTETLESQAELIAESFTPLGEGQEEVFVDETAKAMDALSANEYCARVYREQEWYNGVLYRYDQTVLPGMETSRLAEVDGFLRSYVQLGDIWSGDYRTYFLHHGVRMAQKDDRESGLRAPLGLGDGNRLPVDVRKILLAGLGSQSSEGEIAFDAEKSMRLATEGEGGVLLSLLLRDDGFRYEILEPSRPHSLRLSLDLDSRMEAVERLELFAVDGKLIYRDERNGQSGHGFPQRWMNVRLTPEGYVTNEVIFLEVEMNPEIPKDLFEFRPPESYSIYEGDRMIRNVMFGGDRLPIDSFQEVRADRHTENVESLVWKDRKVLMFRALYVIFLLLGLFSFSRLLRSRAGR